MDRNRMKNLQPLRMLLAAFFVFILGIGGLAVSQSDPAPSQSKAAGAPGATNTEFKPGFDDLMTMLIQPRHIKLYYAGTQKNWELAAAQARDLRLAFDRIAQTIPKYMGLGVDETLKSIMVPKLKAMDAAIAAAEPKLFAKAYDEMTAACNGCHSYMEHPFHVIIVPGSSRTGTYGDQDFNPIP
jgi:hypothetical protein